MTLWKTPVPPKPKKPPISVDEWLRTLHPLESYKTHRTGVPIAPATVFQRGTAASQER